MGSSRKSRHGNGSRKDSDEESNGSEKGSHSKSARERETPREVVSPRKSARERETPREVVSPRLKSLRKQNTHSPRRDRDRSRNRNRPQEAGGSDTQKKEKKEKKEKKKERFKKNRDQQQGKDSNYVDQEKPKKEREQEREKLKRKPSRRSKNKFRVHPEPSDHMPRQGDPLRSGRKVQQFSSFSDLASGVPASRKSENESDEQRLGKPHVLKSADTAETLPSVPRRNKSKRHLLSKKEMALKKKKNQRKKIERKSSLDLLDPELDALPGTKSLDQTHGFIISPESEFVTYWASLIYMLTIYNLLVIPFRMSFGFISDDVGFWFFFDLITDLFFIVDIYLSFHIGFYKNGRAILNLHQISKRYRNSWLILDVIATMPLDFIQIQYNRIIPSARAPKLLRFVHIVRKISIVENQPGVNVSFVRLTKLVFYSIFINHFAACGWFAFSDRGTSFGQNAWMPPAKLENLGSMSRYLHSLQWATSQMSGKGIGSFPTNGLESIFHYSFILICMIFIAYVVGTIVSLIDAQNATAIQFQSRVNYVVQFMQYQGLSKKLRQDVLKYFSYMWKSHRGFDSQQVMRGLPTSLSLDIQVYLAKDLVTRSPLFAKIQSSALSAVVAMLESRVCAPGEYILHVGIRNSSMFFVQQGELELIHTKDKVIDELSEGDFCGQLQLFLGRKSVVSIRAKTFCQLYEFTPAHLQTLLETYPADTQNLIRMAKQYSVLHGASGKDGISTSESVAFKGDMSRTSKMNSDRVDSQRKSEPNSEHTFVDMDDDIIMTKTTSLKNLAQVRSLGGFLKLVRDCWRSESTILPNSNMRRLWSFTVSMSIFYNIITVPFRVGFLPNYNVRYHWAFVFFDIVSDLILAADILLRFRMAIILNGKIVDSPSSVRSLYLRKGLPWHLFASLPLDWILLYSSPTSALGFRFLRLARVGTFMKIVFQNRSNTVSHALLSVLTTVFSYFLLTHFLSAVLVSIARSHEHGSDIYRLIFGSNTNSPFEQYIVSVVLASHMLMMVGSGYFEPYTDTEIVFNLVVRMSGIFLAAFFFGGVSSFLVERNAIASDFSHKLLTTHQFMEFRKVPASIRARTQKYFDYLWSTMRGIDPQIALAALPKSLRTEIMIDMCRNIMNEIPLFEGVPDRFMHDLVPRLAYEVFPANEFIFKRGEMSNNKMYFVARGILSIILDETLSSKPLKLIGTGSFFGEVSLLTNNARGASILTETPSHLLSLSSEDLFELLGSYPVFEDRMYQFASQRIRRLTKTMKNLDETLQEVIEQMGNSKLIQNRTYRFIRYESCFVGCELIDWLIDCGYADDRDDGLAIGVSLYEKGLIRYVTADENPGFLDSLHFYRLASYVNQMARADETKVAMKVVPEDMKFLEKVVEELIKSELYLLETNILSGEQIIQILISKGFAKDGSVENAVQIGQRLIDAHKLQSMQEFEEFENSSEFYLFRAMNKQDPCRTGPSVSDLMLGKPPAFVGNVVIQGHHTFTRHFAILSGSFPGILYLYSSKQDEHPQRILDIYQRFFTVWLIENMDSTTKTDLNAITISGRDYHKNRILSPEAPKCTREVTMCFSSQASHQKALDILKAQGYTQKIQALMAQNWHTALKAPSAPVESHTEGRKLLSAASTILSRVKNTAPSS